MFNFPQFWYLIVIIGIVWEIIESSMKDRPFYLMDCNVELSDSNQGWWYGRWQDIVMNSFGMILGYILYKNKVTNLPFVISLMGIILFHILI